jgi:hypothetical protein
VRDRPPSRESRSAWCAALGTPGRPSASRPYPRPVTLPPAERKLLGGDRRAAFPLAVVIAVARDPRIGADAGPAQDEQPPMPPCEIGQSVQGDCFHRVLSSVVRGVSAPFARTLRLVRLFVRRLPIGLAPDGVRLPVAAISACSDAERGGLNESALRGG